MTTTLGGPRRPVTDDMPDRPRFLDQLDFAAVPTASRCARVFTSTTLTKWKALSLVDDACLMVSELVTNAVQATGLVVTSPTWPELEGVAVITVRLVGLKNSIVIEVRDCDPSEPVLKEPTLDEDSGRGLFLVDSLAARWGSYPDRGGKVVWAELPVYPGASHGLPKRPWSPPSTRQPAGVVEAPLPTAEPRHRPPTGYRAVP
jgi:Histidine kinase-like ATPase domain